MRLLRCSWKFGQRVFTQISTFWSLLRNMSNLNRTILYCLSGFWCDKSDWILEMLLLDHDFLFELARNAIQLLRRLTRYCFCFKCNPSSKRQNWIPRKNANSESSLGRSVRKQLGMWKLVLSWKLIPQIRDKLSIML